MANDDSSHAYVQHYPVHNIDPEEIQCLQRDRNRIFEKVLGAGSFGRVVKRVWRNRDVAVKVFHEGEKKAFHPELEQLSRVNHPNIIKLLASSVNNGILVLEYAERGSLYNVLHTIKDREGRAIAYHSGHAISWCLQCAMGVEYLHQIKPNPIIHRDLKTPNLLLVSTTGLTLKICDFGTACDKRTEMTNNMGSAPWMAPEVFRGKNYTEKCDVYSYGTVVWEILSRQLPFKDKAMPIQIQWAVVQKERPPKIKDCPKPLENLIENCWMDDVNARPDMTQIVHFMKTLQPLFPEAIDPLVFPDDDNDDETIDSSHYTSAPTSMRSTSHEVDEEPTLYIPTPTVGINPLENNMPNKVYGTPPEEPLQTLHLPTLPEGAAASGFPFQNRTFQEYLNENPGLRLPGDSNFYPNENTTSPPRIQPDQHSPAVAAEPAAPGYLRPTADLYGWRSGPHHYLPNIIGNTYYQQSESEEFKFFSNFNNKASNKSEEDDKKSLEDKKPEPPPLLPSYRFAGHPPTNFNWPRTPPKKPQSGGIAMFVPHYNNGPSRPGPQDRLSPYHQNSPYDLSAHGSREFHSRPLSGQGSFNKGHKRSSSDSSSVHVEGTKDMLYRQQFGRSSFSHIPHPGHEKYGAQGLLQPPHPSLGLLPSDFPYDMSMLDRDMNLINPECRPTPPQPNCPQSMYIYSESRMMVAKILAVKNEAEKMQRHIEQLQQQDNQSDRELAIGMVENGDLAMDKDQVVEYFDLMSQKESLQKQQEELTEQYEALKKDKEMKGKVSKRSYVRRLFSRKTPDKSPTTPVKEDIQQLSVVNYEDWDVVLKEGESDSLLTNQET